MIRLTAEGLIIVTALALGLRLNNWFLIIPGALGFFYMGVLVGFAMAVSMDIGASFVETVRRLNAGDLGSTK